jgi:hypothetical protein
MTPHGRTGQTSGRCSPGQPWSYGYSPSGSALSTTLLLESPLPRRRRETTLALAVHRKGLPPGLEGLLDSP